MGTVIVEATGGGIIGLNGKRKYINDPPMAAIPVVKAAVQNEDDDADEGCGGGGDDTSVAKYME